MTTAEELLCSRKWRMARGSWMLLGFVPFAATAWIGYLIVGIRSRSWRILVISGLFLAWFVAWLVWSSVLPHVPKGDTNPDPVGLNVWGFSGLVVWLGNAFWLQWWVNRRWLVWRARHDKSLRTPWYATATQGTTPPPPDPAVRVNSAFNDAFAQTSASVPPPTATAGAGQQPHGQTYDSVPNQVPSMLDLNSATRDELAALPGLDLMTAAHVIEVREQIGGFRELAELVSRAGIKPHVFAAVQAHLVLGGTTTAPSNVQPDMRAARAPASGRRLDF